MELSSPSLLPSRDKSGPGKQCTFLIPSDHFAKLSVGSLDWKGLSQGPTRMQKLSDLRFSLCLWRVFREGRKVSILATQHFKMKAIRKVKFSETKVKPKDCEVENGKNQLK